jgi:hypothetical protein
MQRLELPDHNYFQRQQDNQEESRRTKKQVWRLFPLVIYFPWVQFSVLNSKFEK